MNTLFAMPDEESPLAVAEMPAARMEASGPAALADSELLALLLSGKGALAGARRLVNELGSLRGLLRADPLRIAEIAGARNTTRLRALVEASVRMHSALPEEQPVLDRADRVATHFAPLTATLTEERFWVCCLNRRQRLLRAVEVSRGTANAALAHPREVFRAAIRENASGVACVHNHPSGDPSPSAADLQLTRQLREAARAVDIPLLDHVIVGRPGADPLGRGHYSFREAGLL